LKCIRKWLGILLLAVAAQAQPKRIVSTFPSITETLFALGAGDRVVGVSTYCRYPPSVLALPKIGTYIKPDPEKIALLRPDLVIIEQSATTLADHLSALNIRHVDVKIGSLGETYSMIRDVGRAIESSAQADKLNAEIQSRLDTIRIKSRSQTPLNVLIIMGRDPGLLTNLIGVGPTTYLSELLEIAGGHNVLTSKAVPYPHISMETVLRLNPDVILDASMMGDAGADRQRQETRLREPWLSHRELAAVQNGRVYGIATEALATPGPRVVDAVELIKTKIQESGREQ
jgi:iron complex transport system substrate-binding protein